MVISIWPFQRDKVSCPLMSKLVRLDVHNGPSLFNAPVQLVQKECLPVEGKSESASLLVKIERASQLGHSSTILYF